MAQNRRQSVAKAAIRNRGYCAKCGRRNDLQAHHLVAIADGGADSASNIEVLCAPCHKKWHRDFEGLVTFNTFLETTPAWFSAGAHERGQDIEDAWRSYIWRNLGGSIEASGRGMVLAPAPHH